MNAAIYTRFSTELQQSTQMQIDQCRAYALKNNIQVISIYSDEGTTGTNTDRGNFQRLVFDAQNKKFDAVIIYDISRGSRDVGDWFNFRKLMSNFSIKVLSTSEVLGDILDPDNYLKELITVGIGQHQVLQSRKKSIDGKTTQAREGLFQGGFAPLGYDIVNQEYTINEREATAVKLIFNLYAAGKSYNYIIDVMQKNGFRGKRGRRIGKNSLYSILQNDRYIGTYSWNRNINRQMHHWVGLKNQNPNKVELKNKIPRLIDDETWCKARKRMESNAKGKNKATIPFLLSGKIICGECGGAFVGHTSTNSRGVKTRYYVCGNKYRTHECKQKNINADYLEAEVLLQTQAWLMTVDPDEYALSVATGFNDVRKSKREDLLNELHVIQPKIRNATEIMLAHPNAKPIFDELMNMKMREADITKILDSTDKIILDPEEIAKSIRLDLQKLDSLDANYIFERYIEKIHVLKDRFQVFGGVYLIVITIPKVPFLRFLIPKVPFLLSFRNCRAFFRAFFNVL